MNIKHEKKQMLEEIEERKKGLFKFLFFGYLIFFPIFFISLLILIFIYYSSNVDPRSFDIYSPIGYTGILASSLLGLGLLKNSYRFIFFKLKGYTFDLNFLNIDYCFDLMIGKVEFNESFENENYLLLFLDMIEISELGKVSNLSSKVGNDMW